MPASTVPTELPEITLFFDGDCGLCNHFVDFALSHDPTRSLRFAPLQGETFHAVAARNPQLADIDSLVVAVRDQQSGTIRLLIRSQGALFILGRLGGVWKPLATVLGLVPTPLSDLGYRLIAKTRYLIFGRRDTCRLATAQEKGLFLP